MTACPALVSDLPNPKVLWYQTDVAVTLRIMLTDVRNYFILVDEDHLRFSTTINGRSYYLCLYLFGAIIPERCVHRNVQREIRVTLPKALRWNRWMRLCHEKLNNPHIIADPDKLEENEIKAKKFVQRDWENLEDYKRENNIFNVLPATHSSDEAESDDEEMDALIDQIDVW